MSDEFAPLVRRPTLGLRRDDSETVFLLTYTLTAHVNETTINKEIVNGRVRT